MILEFGILLILIITMAWVTMYDSIECYKSKSNFRSSPSHNMSQPSRSSNISRHNMSQPSRSSNISRHNMSQPSRSSNISRHNMSQPSSRTHRGINYNFRRPSFRNHRGVNYNFRRHMYSKYDNLTPWWNTEFDGYPWWWILSVNPLYANSLVMNYNGYCDWCKICENCQNCDLICSY